MSLDATQEGTIRGFMSKVGADYEKYLPPVYNVASDVISSRRSNKEQAARKEEADRILMQYVQNAGVDLAAGDLDKAQHAAFMRELLSGVASPDGDLSKARAIAENPASTWRDQRVAREQYAVGKIKGKGKELAEAASRAVSAHAPVLADTGAEISRRIGDSGRGARELLLAALSKAKDKAGDVVAATGENIKKERASMGTMDRLSVLARNLGHTFGPMLADNKDALIGGAAGAVSLPVLAGLANKLLGRKRLGGGTNALLAAIGGAGGAAAGHYGLHDKALGYLNKKSGSANTKLARYAGYLDKVAEDGSRWDAIGRGISSAGNWVGEKATGVARGLRDDVSNANRRISDALIAPALADLLYKAPSSVAGLARRTATGVGGAVKGMVSRDWKGFTEAYPTAMDHYWGERKEPDVGHQEKMRALSSDLDKRLQAKRDIKEQQTRYTPAQQAVKRNELAVEFLKSRGIPITNTRALPPELVKAMDELRWDDAAKFVDDAK